MTEPKMHKLEWLNLKDITNDNSYLVRLESINSISLEGESAKVHIKETDDKITISKDDYNYISALLGQPSVRLPNVSRERFKEIVESCICIELIQAPPDSRTPFYHDEKRMYIDYDLLFNKMGV